MLRKREAKERLLYPRASNSRRGTHLHWQRRHRRGYCGRDFFMARTAAPETMLPVTLLRVTRGIKDYLIPSIGAALYLLSAGIFYDDPEAWNVRALGGFTAILTFACSRWLPWVWSAGAPRPLAVSFPFIALLPIGLMLTASPIAPPFAFAPFFMILFAWGLVVALAAKPSIISLLAFPLSTMALHSVSLTLTFPEKGRLALIDLIISAVVLVVVTYPLWPVVASRINLEH